MMAHLGESKSTENHLQALRAPTTNRMLKHRCLGNEELPHKVFTGIKLDKTAPTGSIVINNGDASTSSTSVTLSLAYTDAASGVYKVRYSNYGGKIFCKPK